MQQATGADTDAPSDKPAQDDEQTGWGFIQSPRWPKPTFDINSIDEAEAPQPAFKQPVQPAAPSYSPPDSEYEPASTAAAPPIAGPRQVNPAYQRSSETRFEPQPYAAQQAQRSAAKPIASVGSNDSYASNYNTGNFARMPQRAEYDHSDDDGFDPAPRGKRGGSARPSSLKRRPPTRSRSTYRNKNNLLFFGAAGVLVVLLLVFGIILINRNFGGISGFFRNVFGGSPILKDPVVSSGVNKDGAECWEITVYAREGNTIYMRVGSETKSDVIGRGNYKILQIPKYMFLPEEPVDSETANLVPDVRIITKDKEEIIVDIPPIPVQVPPLTLTVTSPAEATLQVGRNKVTVAGTVDDGAVAVTLNGETVPVAADGAFSIDYTLPEVGSHTLMLEARKNGHQIARHTLQVEYTQTEANIDVDRTTLRAPGDGDTATVKGTVDANSTISLSGPAGVTLGSPNINNATGLFSFTVQMAAVGHYPIEINISKDGVSSSGTIIVERAPVYADYTAKVYKMAYDRMLKEPQHTAAYKCVGKVTEVLQTEPYVIAKLNTSSGDILFEYHNTTASVSTEDKQTYNVFGDYVGIDEGTGLPLVYGWFITKSSN